MSRCFFTRKAQEDLREIRAFVANRDTPQAADRLLRILRDKCRVVAETPGVGRPRDDLSPGVRSVVAGSYVIFYRTAGHRIDVVRVLHGARDIEHVFQAANDS